MITLHQYNEWRPDMDRYNVIICALNFLIVHTYIYIYIQHCRLCMKQAFCQMNYISHFYHNFITIQKQDKLHSRKIYIWLSSQCVYIFVEPKITMNVHFLLWQRLLLMLRTEFHRKDKCINIIQVLRSKQTWSPWNMIIPKNTVYKCTSLWDEVLVI